MHAAFYPVFCDFVIVLQLWCISLTSAMLFAPVHGGCYIISRVGIEERNVMYSVCIIIRFECSGRVTDGFPKKKLDRGWVGGWVELYPKKIGFLEIF